MAMVLSGWVSKKTKALFSRWQKKYFQVIANGAYLAYYDKQPERLSKDVLVPNGVLLIHEVIDIRITQPKQFTFVYDKRMFEF